MYSRGIEYTKILIIDDDPSIVTLLTTIFHCAGFHKIIRTTDARQSRALYLDVQLDLILLDLIMPGLTGFQAIEQLLMVMPDNVPVPILVLTGDTSRDARQRALTLGAKDFVNKPFDRIEALARVRNLLETRLLQFQLADKNRSLEQRVRPRTSELEQAQVETLERLALTAEFRDDDTGEHTRRVGKLAGSIAAMLGLPASEVKLIARAAPLHDIGKIGIPDQILLKPGKLTPDEFEIVKRHTVIGGQLLAGSDFAILQLAKEIAAFHHERWDGTDCPHGLAGDDIPLAGRIVAVADVFDALTHERPYKLPWTIDEAAAELHGQRGRQFDPVVIDAFEGVRFQLGLGDIVRFGRSLAQCL